MFYKEPCIFHLSLVTAQLANTVELDVWKQPKNLEIYFALRRYIIQPVNNVHNRAFVCFVFLVFILLVPVWLNVNIYIYISQNLAV